MKLLIESFHEIYESYPDIISLQLEDGKSLTYRQLNDISENIAAIVCDNIVPNPMNDLLPLVAITMERNIAIIASMLAVLKAGCTYVHVDPSFPQDRQSYIFTQSKCQLLITD